MTILIMDDMNDYLSNPKCDEWNNPASAYHIGVTYQWTHKATGESGLRYIRVKHISHAQRIVEHWNSIQDDYLYSIMKSEELTPPSRAFVIPYPVGTLVSDDKGRQAVISQFIRRDEAWSYALTYLTGGKSAWHDHADLTLLDAPNEKTIRLLIKAGDL